MEAMQGDRIDAQEFNLLFVACNCLRVVLLSNDRLTAMRRRKGLLPWLRRREAAPLSIGVTLPARLGARCGNSCD